MADIVISEFMDEEAVEDLSRDFDVLYDPELADQGARLLGALGGARALIVRNRTQVTATLLDAARALRVVGRLGVGLDNIDTDRCRAQGIEVCPALGANDIAVAEYVIAAAMLLLRAAYRQSQEVRRGNWPRVALIGGEVHGKTLGLLGFGGIAREVVGRAAGLGMKLQAFDTHLPADHPAWAAVERCDFDRLLATSDALSLHVPLTEDTRNLLGAAEFATLPKGAVVINTSRGGVVDEVALANALRSGHLGGAALDVFESEPLDAAAGEKFEGIENILLTPHIAGVTRESNARVSRMTAENVRRVLSKEP